MICFHSDNKNLLRNPRFLHSVPHPSSSGAEFLGDPTLTVTRIPLLWSSSPKTLRALSSSAIEAYPVVSVATASIHLCWCDPCLTEQVNQNMKIPLEAEVSTQISFFIQNGGEKTRHKSWNSDETCIKCKKYNNIQKNVKRSKDFIMNKRRTQFDSRTTWADHLRSLTLDTVSPVCQSSSCETRTGRRLEMGQAG